MKEQIAAGQEHITNLSNMNSKKWKTTAFCLGHRFSKHKMTRYAKNLGGMSSLPPLATPMKAKRVNW